MKLHLVIIFLLLCGVTLVMSCVYSSKVVTGDDGKQYQEDSVSMCGMNVKTTRKPIVSAQQRTIDDDRKAKEQARATYRRLALFCGIAAIVCAVVGCTTSIREAGGAAWILGGASILCMWVSLMVTKPWVIALGVGAMSIAAAVHFKLLDFDVVEKVKSLRAKRKES